MATAQELMEQNPKLSQAVDGLAEATLEEQVLAKLKEIEAILTKLDSESIDLSVFLSQIQSFSDEKKAELQALVDKIDNPLGSKTITFKTIDQSSSPRGDSLFFQEVYMKDGEIKKYGDLFIMGQSLYDAFGLGAPYPARQQFPQDVEFDYFNIYYSTIYARPKAGQSDVGGVSGSLDNYIFVLGYGASGAFGNGASNNTDIAIPVRMSSRVKKVCISEWNQSSESYTGALILLENGELYCAGHNDDGDFGLGNTASTNTWTKTQSDVLDVWKARTGQSIIWKSDGIYAAGSDLGFTSTWVKKMTFTPSQSTKDKCFFFGSFWDGSAGFANIYFEADGFLYGYGYNGYNQLTPADKTNKNVPIKILDSNSREIQVKDGDSIYCTGADVFLLKDNGAGGFDFYSGGRGGTGYGDSTPMGSRALTKVKTFSGDDWKFYNARLVAPNTSGGSALFIGSVKNKKMYAIGVVTPKGYGVGATTSQRALKEVLMPSQISNASQVEFAITNFSGARLQVIVDGVLWSSGDASNGNAVASSKFLQIQYSVGGKK